MPKLLQGKFFWLALVLISIIPHSYLWSQVGCGGFNGAPQPSGGVSSEQPGSLCLNEPTQVPGEITIVASNVADGSNPNNFAVEIDWDDGSPRQIIAYGGAIPIDYNAALHRYEIKDIQHVFLPKPCNATMGRRCAYKPRIYLRIAGVTCPAEFGNPPDFFRFNTDDQCSGNMEISETATGAPVFEVCAGTSTAVTFTDRTILNCLPPQELTGLNSARRWRRIVYGTAGSNITGVLINGAAVGFPFNAAAAPDVSGQPLGNSNPPFANNVTLPITIPATATVGQEFHIRMEYWNICNQYDDGVGVPPVNGDNAPVFIEGIIRVVDQPPAATPINQVVCNGTNPLPNFQVNITQPRTAVLWYRDNANSPGAAITNPNGTNNINFPVSAYPGGINASTAGVYRLWASYRSPMGAGSLVCESPPVPVTLTIRESIPTPGPISGTNEVCNGASGVSFSVPVAAAAFPIGGPTEYQWDVVNNGNGNVGDVTLALQPDGRTVLANFNIADATFGGASSIVRRIRVRRRYTTNSTFPGAGSTCPSARADFTITVYRNTNSGSIAGGGDFCQGANLGNITWTPGIGTIQRWEMSTNGGPTSTIASFSNTNPVNPTSLNLGPGSHNIWAVIQNGVCAPVLTDPVTFNITANPDVAIAGPDQDVCIPAGALLTTLAGNTPGVTVSSSEWSLVSGPGTASFSDATAENSTVTVSAPGDYVFRWTLTAGICVSEDEVTVSFGREPSIPNPYTDNFCGLSGILDADPVAFENATWSLVSGPGTATIDTPGQIPSNVTVSAYGTYHFNLRFSSGSCTPQDTEVEIVFNQPASVDVEEDKVVCVGATSLDAFDVTGTIGGGALQGQWELDPLNATGSFLSGSTPTSGPVINGNYKPDANDYARGYVILILAALDPDGAGKCTVESASLRIDFDQKPDDASVPAGISVCGTTANLNADAPTNGGIGSWSVITVGPNIADPADRTSSVNNLQVGANEFRWTVNSALGTCPATEAVFTVTQITAPTVNNISPADLCESNPNSGIESDVPLATRYNDLITGGAAGVNVEWFTNAARTLPVADVNDEDVANGSIYYIRVSTTGTPVCSSDGVVNFTVNAKPFVANLNPQQCEETQGGGVVNNIDLNSLNADVALNLPNRSVTWFADAALNTLVTTPADVDNVINNTVYYARVENTVTGCYNTADVTFNINSRPTDNPIQGPNKVCLDADDVIFFKVTTLKANHTYQWNIPSPPNGAVNVTGITNDFFVLLQFPDAVAGGVDIEVIETSPQGCAGNPQIWNVTIEDRPNALTIAGPDEVCEGETGVEFEADDFGYNYLWSVPPGASIIGGQGTHRITVNFGSIAGDVLVTPSTPDVGCAGDNALKPVAINLRPVLANLDKEVCSKQDAQLELNYSGAEPATSYNILTRVSDAGLFQTNGVAVPPAIVGANENILADQAFENKTGGPLNVRYTVVPVSAKDCPGNSRVVTLRVNPEPQLDPNLGKDLCSEERTEITIRPDVGSAVADKYIIQSIDNPNGLATVNPLPISGVEFDEDVIFNDRWIHPGAPSQSPVPLTVSYRVIPKNSVTGCVGDPPVPVTLRIFPKPVIDPVADNPKVICSDDDVNIQLTSSNVSAASISWAPDVIGVNITGAKSGNTGVQPGLINDVLVNNGLTQDNVSYRVVAENPASLNSCLSDPYIVQVNVNPSPNTIAELKEEACSDNPNNGLVYTANLTGLQSSISSSPDISFDWYQDNPPTTPVPNAVSHPMVDAVKVYVQVTNNVSGCKKVVPVEYKVNNDVALDLAKTDLTCFENGSGRITSTGSFGTTPYSYSIDGGPFIAAGSSYTFQFLGAAQYAVQIRDTKGCTDEGTITLAQPSLLAASIDNHANVSCFFDSNGVLDKDGVIEVTASGGTGPYKEYVLLPNNIKNTTGLFNGLRPGTYYVQVIDQNNCIAETNQETLVAPTQVEITSVKVAADALGNNLSCKDATDGEVDVTAQGGNVPANYTFFIARSSDPNNPFDQLPGDDVSPVTFTGLSAGTYRIVASDFKGCRSAPGIAIILNPLDLYPGFVGINQSICSGDDASQIDELVEPFGGVGNYQYQWQWSLTGSANPAEWNNISTAEGGDQPEFDPGVLTASTYFRRLVRSISTRTGSDCGIVKGDNPGDKVLVTVNPLPHVSFEPLTEEVCQGSPLVINVTLQPGTGTFPLLYDYVKNSEPPVRNQITPQIIVPNFQEDASYTLTYAEDANGCRSPDVPITRAVKVIKINPEFSIVGPNAQCPGGEFQFSWTIENAVSYKWEWFDGSAAEEFTSGSVPLGSRLITHAFTGGSTASSTVYPVRLTATHATCGTRTSSNEVTVYPSIALNILPEDLVLCSGETLRIKDQSLGVDKGTWYYREIGTTARLEEKSGPVSPLTYVMINNTTVNPKQYEVVYEAANNEGCTDQYQTVVTVYRGINANFNVGNVPEFTGGTSEVMFTNTSAPVDHSQFEYSWDWGDPRAIVLNENGINYTVEYQSPGEREIILKAVNMAARAAGENCSSSFSAKININQPDLNADFLVTPLASCFPTNIVATNLSPGADTFLWELKSGGVVVDDSRLRHPTFRITKPGVYELTLTASYSRSTQPAVVKGPVVIQVFDVPSALFELFQTKVYIPGTEVKTINKSLRANVYEWDFEDGFSSTEIQPSHLYALEGNYTITLRAGHDYGEWDTDGDPGTPKERIVCYDTTQRTVTVIEGGSLRIPNAFTPNVTSSSGGVHDPNAINDVFLPIMEGVEEFTMQIFDRWGNLLFESRDKNIGWDGYDRNGRLMPAGVYVYKLVLRLGDNQRTTKVGDVTLIR